MGKTFVSSSGTWTKAGSGNVTINFVSADKENVRVNIMSDGKKIDEVPVKKGKTVTWTKSVADLQGKTFVLGPLASMFLGTPGTGGGSLLLWVPHSLEDGSLEPRAQLNMVQEHARALTEDVSGGKIIAMEWS
ncbi:hypothetical protein FI667_g14874, partial [Globisporangium splendens]